MHTEHLKQLRETCIWLRDVPQLPEGSSFDMELWKCVRSCGTQMCLLGWHIERNPACVLQLFTRYPDSPDISYSLCLVGDTIPDRSDWGIIMTYFDIPRNVAVGIFTPAASRERDDDAETRREYAEWTISVIDRLLAGEEIPTHELLAD